MKKRSLLLILVLMLTILSSPISAVSAQSTNRPMECLADLTFNPNNDPNCWHGTVRGCSVAGQITICEEPASFMGKTEHYFEVFTIEPWDGGQIYGVDAGVWNFTTFKFRANGFITGASPEWVDLVGFKFHEMGTTTDPALGWPITALNSPLTLHQP